MFKHLFKMIWNKKKQNFLLISEMFISFLVMFAVFTLLVYYYRNYKKPMGIDYENVWIINYSSNYETNNSDSLSQFYETLRQTVKSFPMVKSVSYCSANVPLYQSSHRGSVTYNKAETHSIEMYSVEDSYKEVLGMKMIDGRWFEKQDAVSKTKPVVINEKLKQKLFGNDNAIGKLLGDNDKHDMRVIGVVEDVKAGGDYTVAATSLYDRIDTSSFHWLDKLAIRVDPAADAVFESRLYKTVANYMKNADIEIEHLDNKRTSINYFSLVPMIVLLIVACFLIINVAMGLFGVLWYNINKRRGEIGLRRAIGATGRSVSIQLVAESLILATLSLTIGVFFAVQFPLLNVFDLPAGVYLEALLLSVIFIYLLVAGCSLYPGKQAAAIYPAVALHED